MAMSPWIPKAKVVQEPQPPFDPRGNGRSPFVSSQWELSSIPAAVKHLFGLTTFLTERDRWCVAVQDKNLGQKSRTKTWDILTRCIHSQNMTGLRLGWTTHTGLATSRSS